MNHPVYKIAFAKVGSKFFTVKLCFVFFTSLLSPFTIFNIKQYSQLAAGSVSPYLDAVLLNILQYADICKKKLQFNLVPVQQVKALW